MQVTYSTAFAGTFSLSGPSGSGRAGEVADTTGVNPQPCSNEPCIKSTGSSEIKFTYLKRLEGKILVNRRSIRQIRQCFPPPTFHAVR